VVFYTPAGSPIAFTEQRVRQVEGVLKEVGGVINTYATINTGIVAGRNYALVYARLLPRNERPLSVQQLRAPLRERLRQIAGITVTDIGAPVAVGSGKPIQVSVQGQDLRELERISESVKSAMIKVNQSLGRESIVEIDSSAKPAKPTISVEVDRALASDLGASVSRLASALRPLLAGEAATTWRAPDDENYDVRVRLPLSGRSSVADLESLSITSTQNDADGNPRMVAARQIAQFNPGLGPTQINRKSLTREVLISANADGVAAGTVGAMLQPHLDAISLPPGYRLAIGGGNKDMAESFGYAVQALALAVIFIYMILASQFGSFIQPVSIMASLPLSLLGVIVALLVWRSSLNIFSVIGFIMLMGLVTKNAILLIDFANKAREQGIERSAALLGAAEIRLRPILMTTLAMVFGMLPLALGIGEGSEQRGPLAHAVIGGLIASTLLTLLVVPVLYSLLDDLARAVRGGRTINPAGLPPG
jgi:HAE1 family hydrophobic/amphiphilic exporter-1